MQDKLADLLQQIDRSLLPHIASLQAIASAKASHDSSRNKRANPIEVNDNCKLSLEQKFSQFSKSESCSSTVEKGRFYAKLHEEGWSKKQIAATAGYKERYVLMLISHSDLPIEIHDMIENKEISPTCAYETWQETGYDDDKTVWILPAALRSARSSGKNRITKRFVDTVLGR